MGRLPLIRITVSELAGSSYWNEWLTVSCEVRGITASGVAKVFFARGSPLRTVTVAAELRSLNSAGRLTCAATASPAQLTSLRMISPVFPSFTHEAPRVFSETLASRGDAPTVVGKYTSPWLRENCRCTW